MILWHDWVQLESPLIWVPWNVQGGPLTYLVSLWAWLQGGAPPQGLFTSKEPLPTAEVSTRVFGQGNQIFYSVTQDSQKHNSRSCQTFLRLRPRTLRASILLVSIGYSEQQTQTRFNVQEDYTRIWVWGRNVGVGEFWRTDYRNMLCS